MNQTFTRIAAPLLLSVLAAACSSGGGESRNSEESIQGTPTGEGDSVSFGEPNENETQIRPGVQVTAAGSACTSNFIYGDAAGNYYIGAAAHCFSPDTNSGIDSCETRNEAIGLAVTIENASHDGSLFYSSWRAMQDNGETPGSAPCQFNDFALIKIDPRDHANIHPAAITYQGPRGLLRGGANVGEEAYSYGQSSFHNGVRSSEEKEGTIRGISADRWQYNVVFDNPGLPGDSGSAVLHETGNALGVLTVVSTCIGLCPGVQNGVMSLEMGLDYANDYLPQDIKLVTWDTFTP